jgi:hypothetical protein
MCAFCATCKVDPRKACPFKARQDLVQPATQTEAYEAIACELVDRSADDEQSSRPSSGFFLRR